MRYFGMPMGMWVLFGKSFHDHLVSVLGYSQKEADRITAAAKPKYREIIASIPEFITPDIREGLLGSMQLLKTCDKGFGMMRLEAHVQELAAMCFDTVAGGERGQKGIRADDMSILRQVKKRIDLEPGEVPTIAELAFEYGLSASKLCRLFREAFGIPIHSYVIESRLCEGAKLLSEGKLSVGEVSRRVGYVKQSQFSAAFKRRFHILPKDFNQIWVKS